MHPRECNNPLRCELYGRVLIHRDWSRRPYHSATCTGAQNRAGVPSLPRIPMPDVLAGKAFKCPLFAEECARVLTFPRSKLLLLCWSLIMPAVSRVHLLGGVGGGGRGARAALGCLRNLHFICCSICTLHRRRGRERDLAGL